MSGLVDGIIRGAGGDPALVKPLTAALRAEARGSQDLLRSRSNGQFVFTAEALHVIGLVLAGLGSIGLVLAVVLGRGRMEPPLGAVIICAAHVVFLASTIVGQTVPALLSDDDARVLGWWPLGRRDIMLARMGTVLIPALQTTAALVGLPLVAYVFVESPPLLAALLLAAAVLLQTVVLAMAAGALTAGLVRGFGAHRARRLAALLVDGNLSVLPLLLLPYFDPLLGFIGAHPHLLDWLPPVWFASFGDPLGGPAAWRGMALAAGLALLTGVVAWRPATPQRAVPVPAAERPGGRVRRHWSDLVPWLLRPWLRGPEGWVVGRLLAAHLRDDWRFGGNVLMSVLLGGSLLWYHSRPDGLDFDPESALLFGGSQTLLIMSFVLPFMAAFSSTPRALWIVALADLDPGRLLAAQRGMVRGLAFAPVLAVFAVRGVNLGVGPVALASSMAIMALEAEVMMLVGQRVMPLMAFSRSYTRDQSSQAVARGLALAGVLMAVAVVNALASEWMPARFALAGLLPLVLWRLHRSVERKVAGTRLNFGEAVA